MPAVSGIFGDAPESYGSGVERGVGDADACWAGGAEAGDLRGVPRCVSMNEAGVGSRAGFREDRPARGHLAAGALRCLCAEPRI